MIIENGSRLMNHTGFPGGSGESRLSSPKLKALSMPAPERCRLSVEIVSPGDDPAKRSGSSSIVTAFVAAASARAWAASI